LTTLLICDDHKILTDALATVVGLDDDLQLVAPPVHDPETAIELSAEHLPDVVLMDIIMPRMNGFDATRQLRRERPNVKVIGLSMYTGSDMASKMREAGAVAYVSKGDPVEKLLEQIRGSVSAAA
jgi:DNA-binding NarL/FixJ family response regulator